MSTSKTQDNLKSIKVRRWAKTPVGLAYRERHKAYLKKWREDNRVRYAAARKAVYVKNRLKALVHYGGDPPVCRCDGNEFRKKHNIGGNFFPRWLERNGWPKGIQVLCYNCNLSKRSGQECAHVRGHRKLKNATRLQALQHYSSSEVPFCARCNENGLEFLQLDHINGGGTQHHKSTWKANTSVLTQLKMANWPVGYRVLCVNCNRVLHE